MRLNRESAELVQRWTLVGADWQLIGDKRGAVRLGFALLVKFFVVVGRFPEHRERFRMRSSDIWRHKFGWTRVRSPTTR